MGFPCEKRQLLFHLERLLHKNVAMNSQRSAESDESEIFHEKFNTEAKRCFATHDEDIDYLNMRIYIILIACVYIQQFNFVQ